MNKQELIRKYENACFATVLVDEVLENLKQLDELQPVKVPQFVADWITHSSICFGFRKRTVLKT